MEYHHQNPLEAHFLVLEDSGEVVVAVVADASAAVEILRAG